MFSARAFLNELRAHASAIVAACETAVAAAEHDKDFMRLGMKFLECPENSIDYAVMEKTRRGVVVPLVAGWSDIGSWPALYDFLEKDREGNVVIGEVLADACVNSYIASNGRLVAAIGLTNVVIVETNDAVLVMGREHGQAVKKIVDALSAQRAAKTD
jgi:mannose-1-phosphate guanylyltransferase